MLGRWWITIGVLLAVVLSGTPRPIAASSAERRPSAAPRRATRNRPRTGALPCGTIFDFQVRLDRALFSPGEIDGKMGDNLRHTVAAFQMTHNLDASGNPDCETWEALGGGTASPSAISYQLTESDVNGPFEPDIPARIEAQASLPALAYRSPLERIAERFHVAPALLNTMNAGTRFVAGETIQAPAVDAFDPRERPRAGNASSDVVIQVTKEDSALRVLGGDGRLLFYAPVSSGSLHDPLPIGDWTVALVKWDPVFRYNPQLFWDADPRNDRAVIKPGPNNPVGVVWIGLNLEHYGIHGTPDPEKVGHAQSHGCVRLTNWDAAHVAGLVKKGTVVHFRESIAPTE